MHIFTKLEITPLFVVMVFNYRVSTVVIDIFSMFDFQWKCCNIHVKEFDEFMEIPPCTRGWHNADPA